jgi:hypothetical protein
MLARHWVEEAYRTLCKKRSWSHLRAEGEFILNDQKTGTVDVTRNSATVSGGSMAYATTDANRQFRIAPGPVYTIITATASSYTLDRVYGGTTTSGASAAVLDAYLTVPADFQRFQDVLDVNNNWRLHLWVTEEELNSWDASRSSTGTSWAVASRRLATAGSLAGRIQYELWPYCTSAKSYPYTYYRKSEALSDSTEFLGVLSDFSDVLQTMALASCAQWPGVEGKKNPYFNLALASQLKREADEMLDRLQVQDEEIYMTWLQTVDFSRIPFAPIDAKFMQSHDTDLGGVAWPH